MSIVLQRSKIHLLLIILLLMILHVNFLRANCKSDVGIGYQVTLAIPPAFSTGFVGRAFLMETDHQLLDPNFRTALSVEAQPDENYYSCSLDIFLGNVKVWSSGHFSRFYTTDKCTLELTHFGDLQLKGQKDTIGWRSGTSGQGVQRLQLLRSGNLVLVDARNVIKWQSFNFPTDIMLWGQRLSSKTRLTSFISNNSTRIFYTLEVQYDKIALFLNYGTWKYTYWEFRPLGEHNITYVELSSDALEIFNGKFQKVAQIASQQQQQEPLRFLALENATGNLGLYYYSAQKDGFEASYQALNITCDLPLACKPYGICTFSQTCSCVRLITRGAGGARSLSGCSSIITGSNGGDESGSEEGGVCGSSGAEMVELEGVTSILRGVPSKVKKVSREGCENLCLDNCSCVAALYTSWEDMDMDGANEGMEEGANCLLYGVVRGVKQVVRGNAILTSYMVKVAKGSSEADAVGGRSSSGLKRWVVVVIGVGDGLVILMVVGGIGWYLIRKRRNNSLHHSSTPPHPPAAAARNPSHSFQTLH